MKKFITLLFAVLMLCSAVLALAACVEPIEPEEPSQPTEQDDTVYASAKVMSINIAGQDMTTTTYLNTVVYPGQTGYDYSYEKRRARLDALVEEFTPDVLLLQEVNGKNWWWPYLVSNEDSFLNTFTQYALVGRTNRIGESDGESQNWYDLYNQLYYNTEKFEAVATGMFYLTAKRTEPFSTAWHESAYYDPDDNNTCVWAVLKDKATGISAVYASTHLKPTGGFLSRCLTNYRQAIQLAEGLYELAEAYADEGGTLSIVVGGDFNLQITHEYNYAYPHLTTYAHYSDAQQIATKTDTSGTARVWGKNKVATYDDGSTSDGYRIDIFFTQGMAIDRYRCLNGTFLEDADGVYYTSERLFDGGAYDLSDHLPIMIEAKIPSKNRTVLAPTSLYRNESSDSDVLDENTNAASVTAQKITFTAGELLNYFTDGQYMQADLVKAGTYGSALRLMATEPCPNLYAYFDYDGLMQAKGLTPLQIASYSKIKITYKTSLTVSSSELILAVLNEGSNTVKYGTNTTALTNSEAYVTATLDIAKASSASGAITDIVFGTMAYANDYSGVCGMFAGDAIYIYSIEFVA